MMTIVKLKLIKKVNREWPVCQVVYVSDGFHHVMDAYETKHIYYILKEKFEEKLPCIMDKAIRQLKVCGSKEMAFPVPWRGDCKIKPG